MAHAPYDGLREAACRRRSTTRSSRADATSCGRASSTVRVTSGPLRRCRMARRQYEHCHCGSQLGLPWASRHAFEPATRREVANPHRPPRESKCAVWTHHPTTWPAHDARRQPARRRGGRGVGAREASVRRLAPRERDQNVDAPAASDSRHSEGRAGLSVPLPGHRHDPRPLHADRTRVRAMTSFRVTSDRVVNGEEVRFHGRLRGRQTGDTGKLLYLQVFTRGRWSTFATPRANRPSGLVEPAYRFSAHSRAGPLSIPRADPARDELPLRDRESRSLRVTVRGL